VFLPLHSLLEHFEFYRGEHTQLTSSKKLC
jgi:hypothetical protein